LALAAALTASSAAQGQSEPDLPGAEDEDAGAPFLEIPGIGRIPMPPGTRVFGPRASPATPVAPQKRKNAEPSSDRRRAATLDGLFAKLAAAEDAREADAVSTAIFGRWARSGSDTIDLLLARAAAAENGGAGALAKGLLDYVVALAPDWPEGYVRRGRALAARGEAEMALPDFEKAARLEPRRFDALTALGAANEAVGDKKRALEAYRRSLAISPRQEDVRKAEERLKLEVEGRDI